MRELVLRDRGRYGYRRMGAAAARACASRKVVPEIMREAPRALRASRRRSVGARTRAGGWARAQPGGWRDFRSGLPNSVARRLLSSASPRSNATSPPSWTASTGGWRCFSGSRAATPNSRDILERARQPVSHTSARSSIPAAGATSAAGPAGSPSAGYQARPLDIGQRYSPRQLSTAERFLKLKNEFFHRRDVRSRAPRSVVRRAQGLHRVCSQFDARQGVAGVDEPRRVQAQPGPRGLVQEIVRTPVAGFCALECELRAERPPGCGGFRMVGIAGANRRCWRVRSGSVRMVLHARRALIRCEPRCRTQKKAE